MYQEAGIQALSPKQISRLLNAHPVRVKAGSDAKIQVTADHAKKLARAGMKGSALTITLDPFAIQHNQHLRALSGKGPKGLKKFQKWTGAIGDFLKPVAKPILGALTEQAVQNINAYGDQSASMAGMGTRGKGPKGLKKFQKWTGAIGDFLKPVAKPVLGALTEQAVQNINAYGDQSASMAGMGPKGLKKFQKWTGAIGEFVKPVAKPVLGALTEQAVKNINAYGDQSASMAGMGKIQRMLKKDRPKRVLSEAQKQALAKGRSALRIKLNEMGAGVRGSALKQAGYGARGSALMQAGYGME